MWIGGWWVYQFDNVNKLKEKLVHWNGKTRDREEEAQVDKEEKNEEMKAGKLLELQRDKDWNLVSVLPNFSDLWVFFLRKDLLKRERLRAKVM